MWTSKSRALRDARVGKLWSTEQLAKLSGVSERTIRALEKSDAPVRLSTVECLAKALQLESRDVARAAPSDGPKAKPAAEPAVAAPAPPKNEPPPRNGRPSTGVTELPRPTRLEELVALERAQPPLPPLMMPDGPVPPFTAKHYQDVFTAFATHDGERSYLYGRIDVQRGVNEPNEARILGTKMGIGARFHIVAEVAPGNVMALTVFTCDAETTRRMQANLGKMVMLLVRVLVVPDEETAKGYGLAFFISPNPKPWGLLVEAVLDCLPPTAPEKSSSRARRSRYSDPQ